MRVDTRTRNVYHFHELSEEAKQKALENQAALEAENFDSDCTIDDFCRIAELIGISFDNHTVRLYGGGTRQEPNIYWSGFWSQGDGACFGGSYEYRKGALKELKAYAPKDEELHRIAKELQDVQKKNFYSLTASVRHVRNSVYISVERSDEKEMTGDAEERISEALRDLMRWLYRALEAEYDYCTSAEACQEAIEANGYEFTEEGEMV